MQSCHLAKMCHCGLKSSKRMINNAPSCIYYYKEKRTQERVWPLYISFQNHYIQADTGKFLSTMLLYLMINGSGPSQT